MSKDSGELQKFLKEWKKEIGISRTGLNVNSKNNVRLQDEKTKYSSQWEEVSSNTQEENDRGRVKREFGGTAGFLLSNFGNEKKSGIEASKDMSEGCPKDVVLLNLPNPAAKEQENRYENHIKKQKTDKEADENLLQLLIADIDEITVIPFFDLQLPREIGLKIFRHLTIQDLCQCASVSKSWKNLAEDELLWFNLGVKLGFVDGKTEISDHDNWKDSVHKAVVQERQLRSRWKERICRIDTLEYERGEK